MRRDAAQLLVAHAQRERAVRDAQLDLVAVPHERERPTDCDPAPRAHDGWPYEVPLMRASEMRTMSFTPSSEARGNRRGAPLRHAGRPSWPTFFRTSTDVSLDRHALVVDAAMNVGVVLGRRRRVRDA